MDVHGKVEQPENDAIGKVNFGIERRYREAHQAPLGEKRSNVRVPHKRQVRIESAVRG
jgi:hypothetical protein